MKVNFDPILNDIIVLQTFINYKNSDSTLINNWSLKTKQDLYKLISN